MSEIRSKRWVSANWPEQATPYDHIRSLMGVGEILEEFIQSRWEDGDYLGLEVLPKTINQSTSALNEYLESLAAGGGDGQTGHADKEHEAHG